MKSIRDVFRRKLQLSAASEDELQPSGGINIKAKDLGKLHKAAAEGHLENLRKLAKRKDVNKPDKKDRTALHIACIRGHAEVVMFLIHCKADVDLCDGQKRSALMTAVQCQHERCVRILLENGAEPNLVDMGGNTALHLAANIPSVSTADLLLKHEAHINAPNKNGFTPLFVAVAKGHIEMAEFLLEEGADVNFVAKSQRSPLMMAADTGHLKMLRLLLRCNPDVTLRDKMGLSAEDYAELHMNHNICEPERDTNFSKCYFLILNHDVQRNNKPSQLHRVPTKKEKTTALLCSRQVPFGVSSESSESEDSEQVHQCPADSAQPHVTPEVDKETAVEEETPSLSSHDGGAGDKVDPEKSDTSLGLQSSPAKSSLELSPSFFGDNEQVEIPFGEKDSKEPTGAFFKKLLSRQQDQEAEHITALQTSTSVEEGRLSEPNTGAFNGVSDKTRGWTRGQKGNKSLKEMDFDDSSEPWDETTDDLGFLSLSSDLTSLSQKLDSTTPDSRENVKEHKPCLQTLNRSQEHLTETVKGSEEEKAELKRSTVEFANLTLQLKQEQKNQDNASMMYNSIRDQQRRTEEQQHDIIRRKEFPEDRLSPMVAQVDKETAVEEETPSLSSHDGGAGDKVDPEKSDTSLGLQSSPAKSSLELSPSFFGDNEQVEIPFGEKDSKEPTGAFFKKLLSRQQDQEAEHITALQTSTSVEEGRLSEPNTGAFNGVSDKTRGWTRGQKGNKSLKEMDFDDSSEPWDETTDDLGFLSLSSDLTSLSQKLDSTTPDSRENVKEHKPCLQTLNRSQEHLTETVKGSEEEKAELKRSTVEFANLTLQLKQEQKNQDNASMMYNSIRDQQRRTEEQQHDIIRRKEFPEDRLSPMVAQLTEANQKEHQLLHEKASLQKDLETQSTRCEQMEVIGSQHRAEIEALRKQLCSVKSELTTTTSLLAEATKEAELSLAAQRDAERALLQKKDEHQLLKNRLTDEAASHREAVSSLSQKLSEAEAQSKIMKNEIHQISLQLTNKELLMDALQRKKDQAGSQVKQLKLTLQAELQKRTQAQSECLLLRQQQQEAQNQRETKEQLHEDFGRLKAKLTEANQKEHQLLHEKASLQKDLETQSTRCEQMEVIGSQHRAEIEALRKQLCSVKSELTTTTSLLAEATKEAELSLAAQRDAERALLQKKDEHQLLKNRLTDEAASHREAVSSLSQKLSEAEAQSKIMKNEIHQISLQLTNKELLMDALQRKKDQAGSQVKQLKLTLQAELQKRTQAQSECLLLRQQQQEAQNQRETKEQLHEDFGRLKAKLTEANQKEHQLLHEKASLQKDLETQSTRCEQMEVKHRAEIEALRKQLCSVKSELTTTTSLLAEATKEAELSLAAQRDAERALLQKKDEHQRLKNRLTDEAASHREAVSSLSQKKNEVHQISLQLTNKELLMDALQRKKDQAGSRVKQLKLTLQAEQQKRTQAQSECLLLRQQQQEAQNQREKKEQLHEDFGRLKAKLTEANQKEHQLLHEKASLQKDLETQSTRCEQMEVKHRAEIEALRKQLCSVKSELTTTTSLLAEATKEAELSLAAQRDVERALLQKKDEHQRLKNRLTDEAASHREAVSSLSQKKNEVHQISLQLSNKELLMDALQRKKDQAGSRVKQLKLTLQAEWQKRTQAQSECLLLRQQQQEAQNQRETKEQLHEDFGRLKAKLTEANQKEHQLLHEKASLQKDLETQSTRCEQMEVKHRAEIEALRKQLCSVKSELTTTTSLLAEATKEAELSLAAQRDAERALLQKKDEHQRLKNRLTDEAASHREAGSSHKTVFDTQLDEEKHRATKQQPRLNKANNKLLSQDRYRSEFVPPESDVGRLSHTRGASGVMGDKVDHSQFQQYHWRNVGSIEEWIQLDLTKELERVHAFLLSQAAFHKESDHIRDAREAQMLQKIQQLEAELVRVCANQPAPLNYGKFYYG